VLRQQDDVARALSQRRERERDDRQPVIQVGPESPRAHRRRQILARRRHDGDIERLASRAAEPAHGALLEDLQQLGLHGERQEPDLVQEDRAAVRRLEQSGLGLAGIGERAALEAEELGLQQRLGNRAAVDVHERTGGPRATAVDRRGQEPLARPRLAENEDRRKPPRGSGGGAQQASDLLPHRHHGGALTQHHAERPHVR
jgi:hypothetical protein